ncbi:hypothetical protein GCM10027395_09190 [Giesbergeria sinuosa]
MAALSRTARPHHSSAGPLIEQNAHRLGPIGNSKLRDMPVRDVDRRTAKKPDPIMNDGVCAQHECMDQAKATRMASITAR